MPYKLIVKYPRELLGFGEDVFVFPDVASAQTAASVLYCCREGTLNDHDISYEVKPFYELNGVQIPEYIIDSIRILQSAGHMLPAIKLAWGFSGASLKEAKDFCDAL